MSYPLETFHVGDMVRIRQWEDMEMEYGVNRRGSIKTSIAFAQRMRPLCGEVAVIETIPKVWFPKVTLRFLNRPDVDSAYWLFSTEMLEPYQEPEFSKDEFMKMLSGG